MFNSGTKLNSNLREKLIKQQEEENNRGDPAFLNYFDLKEGEQMEVLLVADLNGELFAEYSTHSARRNGVKGINCCYTSSGEPCAPCQHGYEIYQSNPNDDAVKKESSEWRKKQHFLGQVIVVKSPIAVPESEDGNLVKKFNMPFSIKEMIVDGIINETVPNPTDRILVIKKTKKNNTEWSTYEKSFFKPMEQSVIPPEFSEAFDAGMIRPYNLKAEIPAPTHEAELVEWLEKALLAKPFRERATSAPTGGTTTGAAVATAPAATTAPQRSGAPATAAPAAGMSLKERLEARRREQTG